MPRSLLCLALALLMNIPTHAQKPAEKPLLETWQAAYFEGLKVGHTHLIVRQVGTKIVCSRTMELTIKRYGSVVPITIEQTSEETASGKVLALGMTQQMGASPKVTLTGTVEGKFITLKNSADGVGRKAPFEESSLGLYAQEMLFKTKKIKPGDKVSMISYEVLIPGPLTIRNEVKKIESVDQLSLKMENGKSQIVREPAKLLRVETQPDPIKIGTTEVRLPGKTVWLDGKLMPVRERFDMPGLGAITMYTTTKEAALKEGVAPDRLPDFGLNVSIPVKQTLDAPYKTSVGVYRITLKEKIPGVFAEDERQVIRNKKDTSFDLIVRAVRGPGDKDSATPPGKEYLDSNVFIDSSDMRIKRLAAAITAKQTSAWDKAVALEKWVHDNMKVSTAVGFPSASTIAKDLEGDCRQHALLLAALCRAVEIPSKTAVGLIYVRETGRSPVFGFHMWTEVWVKGRWVALDAILGQGSVGATHLKMGDHSWGKTATLAPLLPIAQALGKIQIDIVSTK